MDHFHFVPQRNLQIREPVSILPLRDVFCGLCAFVILGQLGPEWEFSKLPSAGSSSSVLGLQRPLMGPLSNSSVLSEGCAASQRGKIFAWKESWLAVGEWSAEGGHQWFSVGTLLFSTIWSDLGRGRTAKWQNCSRGYHALSFHTHCLIPF